MSTLCLGSSPRQNSAAAAWVWCWCTSAGAPLGRPLKVLENGTTPAPALLSFLSLTPPLSYPRSSPSPAAFSLPLFCIAPPDQPCPSLPPHTLPLHPLQPFHLLAVQNTERAGPPDLEKFDCLTVTVLLPACCCCGVPWQACWHQVLRSHVCETGTAGNKDSPQEFSAVITSDWGVVRKPWGHQVLVEAGPHSCLAG